VHLSLWVKVGVVDATAMVVVVVVLVLVLVVDQFLP